MSSSADLAAGPSATRKAVRKDAARNREALLTAATDLYAERGVEASLEEIARRAGVGIGTLYRNFPTRDALTEAVYRREVEALSRTAADLLGGAEPVDALAEWMRRFTAYAARKKGMAAALKAALGDGNELFMHSRAVIRQALAGLLEACVAAGQVRPDADVDDLLSALSGICMASDAPDWSARSARLVDLIVDGLRYRAAADVPAG
jgi:AcrR family transcriptional regulator